MNCLRLLPVLVVLTFTTPCLAADTADTATPLPEGLAVIDWLIIAAYAASTVGLGWYYSRRQTTTDEYFVGSGRMNPLLIGVSLFATLLSTISYLSMPGETLGKGPVHMTSMIAFPLVFLIVGFGLLPVFMRQRVTSAYELLEARLGLSIRLLGASMFIALRLVWMSLLIYLTSVALTIMMGISESWAPLVAVVAGSVAVVYTTMGGLRAVVITDFMQTILLYGGALLVLGTITWDLGGFSWVPTEWNSDWDTQPVYSFDPSTRITVLGSILTYLVWFTCTSGGDQTSVQRFMATEDAGAARRALFTQLCVSVLVAVTLGAVGFALYGYFEAHPERLPETMALKTNADKVFPYFIAYQLPAGISGLVVAAMFAAAMSSIDSGVNSITAVVLTDFLDRFDRKPQTEEHHLRMARALAIGIGATVVLSSSMMGAVPGNITAVTNKTANLLTTPIFGLFFFALFVPFASTAGVWVGAVSGTTTAVLIAFSGPIFGMVPGPNPGEELDPISFQWIAPASLAVNVVTGSVASLLLPNRDTASHLEPATESSES